jgi:DNA mismatch repair protein MutS
LEQGQRDHAERTAAAEDAPLQLSLFGAKNPVLDELEKLDVNALSPLEALNKLFEWKKKAG